LIEGEPWAISLAVLFPPDLECAALDANSIIYAKSCFEEVAKAAPSGLGAHWGVLGHCAAMIGDPGRAASIYEEHWREIAQPGVAFLAESSGAPLNELRTLPPECQEIVADLWESAHQPDKVIESLEGLRKVHPRRRGVNRRLAEIYARQTNHSLAYERLRAEADCDEAFGEDPIVSFALRSGIAFRELQAQRERYESAPAVKDQIARVRTSLLSNWKPFSAMSEKVREDWIWATLWCEGGLDAAFETVRPQNTVFSCARALENHLREQIFEPLRRKLSIDKSPSPTEDKLWQFIAHGRIELGTMLFSIREAQENADSIALCELWAILRGHSSRPAQLRHPRWQQISVIRNRNSHQSQAGSIEDARRLVALCRDFLAILEDQPKNAALPANATRPQ